MNRAPFTSRFSFWTLASASSARAASCNKWKQKNDQLSLSSYFIHPYLFLQYTSFTGHLDILLNFQQQRTYDQFSLNISF